ncbi:DUF2255 family protein [Actinoplanes sp. M2I2]|uniref:DUF2255 family protein n=1 Tax=Actinoplanes sp. M2I2 TaxID=1734444 RepID=UPI002021447C|nr:DUF2255 family protein [Actinoplanes sp. M2I2]
MAWNSDELARIGGADELEIASRRDDGTLRPYVTIWVVRAGDQLYVRSAYGTENGWFRRARAAGAGRIRAGGVERDVTFADASAADPGPIDRVYHEKYDHYGPKYVDPVVGAKAAEATLALIPQDS